MISVLQLGATYQLAIGKGFCGQIIRQPTVCVPSGSAMDWVICVAPAGIFHVEIDVLFPDPSIETMW